MTLNKFLLIFSLLLFGISCGDTNASVKETKTQKAIQPEKSNTSGYWSQLRSATGISKPQTTKLIGINRKFSKKQKALRQDNKWKGQANKKTRQSHAVEKIKAIKEVLGPKLYQKKLAFDKKRRKANAAKKS